MLANRIEAWGRKSLEDGLKEGLEEGIRRGQAQMLRRQLTSRFGALPKDIHLYLDQADTSELEQWAENTLNASALEAVFYPAAEQSRHLRDAPHPGQSACPLPPLQLDDLRTLEDMHNMLADRIQHWRKESRAYGLKQGLQEGERRGQAQLLRRQFTCRFGSLPNEVERRLGEASATELEQWADNILEASSLEHIFSSL